MSEARTIQIFLPHGEPRGIRIAEFTTRIVQAVAVPRTQMAKFEKRPESENIACYFLFGESDDSAKPLVYIGQTESTMTRMKSHDSAKEFWTTAVFVISRTNSFTQAHIRYLEWLSISRAGAAGRYALDNGNAGSQPYVPEPIEADLEDVFETASMLLSALGHPVFESVAGNVETGEDTNTIFTIKGPDRAAKGRLVSDGFVILKDSLIRSEIVPSMAESSLPSQRVKLVTSGILIAEGDSYRFTEDYLFRTPSGAACMVLGRTANGWQEWKTEGGTTLDSLRQDEVEVM